MERYRLAKEPVLSEEVYECYFPTVAKDDYKTHVLSVAGCPGRLNSCYCWRFRKFDNRHPIKLADDEVTIKNMIGRCCMMTGWNATEDRHWRPRLYKKPEEEDDAEEEEVPPEDDDALEEKEAEEEAAGQGRRQTRNRKRMNKNK